MKTLAVVATVLSFAGSLFAQETRTETTTTTWNGTLVDEGCRTTRTQKETTTKENAGTTETKTTTTTTTECPVTTTTTTFALLTPEGRYVHFDDAGNTRIVEMVKKNKVWTTSISKHKPLRVRIVGSKNGDVVVIKEIQ